MSQLTNLRIRARETRYGWVVERRKLFRWKHIIGQPEATGLPFYFLSAEDALEKAREVLYWAMVKSVYGIEDKPTSINRAF